MVVRLTRSASLLLLLLPPLGASKAAAQPAYGSATVHAGGVATSHRVVTVADVTGDGLTDVLWQAGTELKLLRGNGSGSFLATATIPIGLSATGPEVAFGDVDGDGLPDTAHGRGDGLTVAATMQTTGGTLVPHLIPLPRPSGRWPVLADADADGDLDLYLVERGLTIVMNDGGGTMSVVDDLEGTVLQDRATFDVGDLDLDGRADLVAPALDDSHDGLDLVFVRNNPATNLPAVLAIRTAGHGLATLSRLRLADLDGDLDQDVVLHGTLSDGSAVVRVLRNEHQSTGAFTLLPAVPSLDRSGGAADLLIADLDGDSQSEVILGCASSTCRSLVVHWGTGLGGLAPAEQLPVLAAARRLETGDVDCDGDLDLVGLGRSALSVVINRGERVFEDQLFAELGGDDLALGTFGLALGPLDVAAVRASGMRTAPAIACGAQDLRACTQATPPVAEAGTADAACTPTTGQTTVSLDGVGSRPANSARPIARYCWQTPDGTFLESGSDVLCTSSPTATLVVDNGAGLNVLDVLLEVTDSKGCSASDQVRVELESGPLVTQARVSTSSACAGEILTFTAAAVDTFSGDNLVTLEWDVDLGVDTNGNGNPVDDVDASVQAVSSFPGVVTAPALAPGARIARVTARGEETACTATAEIGYQVASAPARVSAGGPLVTCPGTVNVFSASQSGASGPVTFRWDFDVTADSDGNGDPTDDDDAIGAVVQWSFSEPGATTVRARASGTEGCEAFDDHVIEVLTPPEADFTSDGPTCGTTVVRFADQSAGTAPLTVRWDFGDGSQEAIGPTPVHAYPRTGIYTVRQTVTDGAGCSATRQRQVVVTDALLELVDVSTSDDLPGAGGTGNGNGFAEPGEVIEIAVTARNAGSEPVSDVSARAVVVSPLSGVTLVDDTASLPSLPAGGTRTSEAPHLLLAIAESVPCGTAILVDVSLTGFGSSSCSVTEQVALSVGLPTVARFGGEVPTTDSEGDSTSAATAFGDDHHATVFVDDSPGVPQVYFVRHLSSGPRLLPANDLSRSALPATEPRLAWSDDLEEFGAVWRQERPDGSAPVAFARLSKTGEIQGDVSFLGGSRTRSPDIAWTGTAWVVVWAQGAAGVDSLKAQLLDGLGRPRTGVLDLGDGGVDHDHVRVVGDGGRWWVAATRSGTAELLVLAFPPGFPAQAVPDWTRTFAGVRNQAPALVLFDGNLLLARADASGAILATLLTPSGQLLSEELAGTGSEPSVDAGNLMAVVTFLSGDQVFARALARTGGVLDQVVTVTAGAGPASEPVVSASPDGLFIVLWTDRRAPHVEAAEIYGTALIPVAGESCIVGDLGDVAPPPSGDGVVNVGDVVYLLRVAVGLEPVTTTILARGDVAPGSRQGSQHRVSGNGVIDVGDVVVLLQASVGQITLVR